MVNAFTFDNGSPKSFASREEMYDYMIENGHNIVEGDDEPKFAKHIEKRILAGNAKAQAMKAKREV